MKILYLANILVTDNPTLPYSVCPTICTADARLCRACFSKRELSTLRRGLDLDYIPARPPKDGSKLKEPRQTAECSACMQAVF